MPGEVCIVVFDGHDGLYIGTDSGDLYFSPDAGERWVNVDHRLPIRHFHKNTLAALAVGTSSEPSGAFFKPAAALAGSGT
jgi:hypothetical protein